MIGFWILMLIVDLFIPLIMIIFGKGFIHNPPRKVNDSFGYRTAMSMKNQDTWNFAHQHCGKMWIKLGVGLLLVSVLLLGLVFGKNISTMGVTAGIVCCVQVAVLVLSFIPTEIALKKTFDPDGKRKNKDAG